MKKRILSSLLVVCMLFALLVGCTGGGDSGGTTPDGKIIIEPGNWSVSSDPEDVARLDSIVSAFEEMYPNITIKTGNTYKYDVSTFSMKVASGQLATTLDTYFTEIQAMIADGLVADITDELEANGLLDKLDPDVLKLCSDENGRVYAFPFEAYRMGLVINKSLFEQAGLVNADGSPKVPETWEELVEYARIIKQKTGTAGFVMPTTGNAGGWQFMNIAWSNGVEFEEQQSDGSWKAVFNTQEFKDSLQYIHDLKWKYGVLPADTLIDHQGYYRIFATGQAAMALCAPDQINLFVQNYGMDLDDIYYAKMPAGTEGRVTQTGGGLTIFNKNATSEQIDAAIKWLMFRGRTYDIDETVEANIRGDSQAKVESGCVVYPEDLASVWDYAPRDERYEEIMSDYANVNMENFQSYLDTSDVVLRAEEPVACQQLYSVLDAVIQEILTNRNADIDALAQQAVSDFQSNYLDNLD